MFQRLIHREILLWKNVVVAGIAIFLVILNWYTQERTNSTTMWVEMVHAIADLCNVTAFVLVVTYPRKLYRLRHLGAFALLVSGIFGLIHVYECLIVFANKGGLTPISDARLLTVVSITNALCILVQWRILPQVHELVHQVNGGHDVPLQMVLKSSHTSLHTEIKGDFLFALSGLMVAYFTAYMPQHVGLARIADVCFAFAISVYMVVGAVHTLSGGKIRLFYKSTCR